MIGLRQANCRRNLALQGVQEDHRWRSLDRLDHRRRNRSIVRSLLSLSQRLLVAY